jgi:electron-transferring-flavoprotein dehydrogenase
VLAEGARGHLTKQLVKQASRWTRTAIRRLFDRHQGTLAGAGRPRDARQDRAHLGLAADNHTYGGSFLYHLDNNQIALGYVSGLDYKDPEYKPWEAFQQWKNHPLIKPLLEGGTILSAGARAIVTGGWQSLPKGGNARRAADRRHRRPAQRAQDQGHPPGHPQRHAGRRTPGAVTAAGRAGPAGFDAKLRASDGDEGTEARCATSSPASRRACGSAC